jgi:Mycothiol maleylpyruvate isomerase N-terminal domain
VADIVVPRDGIEPLDAIYGQLTVVADALTESSALLSSRCAGWAVTDVLYHQLMDARRALVTFASPADREPDTDSVSYWRPFAPASGDLAAGRGEAAVRYARHVRIVASAYPVNALAAAWRQTAGAALRAARACPYQVVATQGHALRTGDFIATLVFEAAVHYLDITVAFPAAEPADPAALALVRQVLDALAGGSLPAHWDDATCALTGTGRLPVSAADAAVLGPLAGRLPLIA